MVRGRVRAQLGRIVARAEVVGALGGGEVRPLVKRAPVRVALDAAVRPGDGGSCHEVVDVAVLAARMLDEAVARVAGVPRVDGGRAVAGLAVVAAQGRHGHERLRQVLGAQVARRGVAVKEDHLVVLARKLGVPRDVLHRRAADLARPLRRLRLPVIGAQDVVAEVLVGGRLGRHVLGREAHRALVHEVPVDDVAAFLVEPDHLVHHGQQKRRVGAGTHADPPRAQRRGRHVVARPHVHEIDARVLRVHEPVHAGVLCPGGVAAVQHDGIGVGQVVFVGAHHEVGMVAVGVQAKRLGLEGPTAERLGFGVVHRAADDGEHGRTGSPAPRVAHDGVLAVLGVHALELVGDVGERVVPADALPFVLAAQLAVRGLAAAGLPALAFHRVLDAVGVVHLLAQGAPAQTAALLRAVEAVLARVVGLLANDDAVHDVAHVEAHLVAVLVAVDGHPRALPGRDGRVGRDDVRAVGVRRQRGDLCARVLRARAPGEAERCRSGRRPRARPQEAAAAHGVVQAHTLTPSPSSARCGFPAAPFLTPPFCERRKGKAIAYSEMFVMPARHENVSCDTFARMRRRGDSAGRA